MVGTKPMRMLVSMRKMMLKALDVIVLSVVGITVTTIFLVNALWSFARDHIGEVHEEDKP